MGRLRIGTNIIGSIHTSAGLMADVKPVIEIGDSDNGSLRAGSTAVWASNASVSLLAGKKPTLEIRESDYGSLRVNTETVRTLHSGAALLGGKKPTIEAGIPLSESGYTPPVSLELVRNGINHWLIDALGGTYMQIGRRGNIDGAVYTVNGSGKVVIPQADGGDVVIDVRGVWLTTETFTWNGFWADTDNEAAVNYYSSHAKVGVTTEITLSPSLTPGTQVQVYYYYSGSQQLGRYTYYNSYPYLYKNYGGPFPEEVRDKVQTFWGSSAVDAEYWFIVACHEAYLASLGDVYNDMATTIISKCREYETISLNYVEPFDYAMHEKPEGVWAKSDYGEGAGNENMLVQIALDPVDSNNKVMKITGYVGVWGIWGKSPKWQFSGSPNFKFRFRGQNLVNSSYTTGIFTLKLKKTDETEWTYAFADTSTSWRQFILALNRFKSIANVVYGDLNGYWWSMYGKGGKSQSEIRTNQMDLAGGFWMESGGLEYYICRKLEFDLLNLPAPAESYNGAGYITGVPAECTSFTTNLNFYIRSVNALNLRLKLKDTVNDEFDYTQYIGEGDTRVTVALSDFSPSAVGKTIDQVYFSIDPGGIYPNEIRWPDKSIGDTGGTWQGAGCSIVITDDNPARSLVAGSKVYTKVVTASTTVITSGYAGFLFNMPSGVDSSRHSKLSWVMRSTMTQNVKITMRDASAVDHTYLANITANQTVRFLIAFGSFDGGAITHPVQDVRVQFEAVGTSITDFGNVYFDDELSVSFPAEIFLTDIKFGDFTTLLGATDIKQYQFGWPDSNTSPYATTTYWDDVGLDYTATDDYAGLPYKSYQWGDSQKKGSWMGPMYLGYLVPAAYYWKGYTTQAALAAQCVRDAQIEFTSRMGRSADSLFMPCHTRALSEGREYSDTIESNIFSFGKPDDDQMEWGGWQYRIAAQLAHYYYLSGNTNAQDALYNLVMWLDATITEDPASSGIWRIPTSVKREGVKIKTTASVGASSVTLKGCPTLGSGYWSGDWVSNKDILYIQNDSTKYVITAAGSPDANGEITVSVSPTLAAQADVDEKVLIIETTTGGVHEKGLMAQMFIYHYWKSGISQSQTWYRRILDDLINNLQEANGSFSGGSSTYGFHQAEIGKAFGMLINGRLGATPTYSLSATSADETAFQSLYDYMINNLGSAKPCSLSLDYLPLHKYEDQPELVEQGASISNSATTTEAISLCMHFALDYGRYSGDYTWLTYLKNHLYEVTTGTPQV